MSISALPSKELTLSIPITQVSGLPLSQALTQEFFRIIDGPHEISQAIVGEDERVGESRDDDVEGFAQSARVGC